MAEGVDFAPIIRAKFRGCMIGGLLGNCLGRPFEFKPAAPPSKINELFADPPDKDSARMLRYTVDTSMTLSVASSLVEKQKIDAKDMAKKFVYAFNNEPRRRYGFHVVSVFDKLKETNFEDVYLPAKLQFEGSGSYGNGAAMRISPIALYASNQDDIFLENAVKESSLITHAHRDGVNGAILLSFAIIAVLELDSSRPLNPMHYLKFLLKKMESIEPKDSEQPYCESLKELQYIFHENRDDIPAAEIAKWLGNDVMALNSVPTSIFVFLRGMKPIQEFENSNPFLRTLYFAISLGGDTDTIASMAGSIAGAYYGEEIIPDALKNRCESVETTAVLANKLYDLAQYE